MRLYIARRLLQGVLIAAGKGFLFSDHGDVELRGFEDPVRLYEVRWRAEG